MNDTKAKKRRTESPLASQTPPKEPPVLDLCGLAVPPPLVGMAQLPRLVIEVRGDGGVDVIAGLLHVQQRKVVVGDLAGGHEAADLALAQLLVLALDGPGRQADAALVELAGDEDRLAADEQVVAGEVVDAAQGGGGHAVAEGEGLDGVVVVV